MKCATCGRNEECGVKAPSGSWLCGYCAIPDMLQHFDVQRNHINLLEDALRKFCRRVEAGEIKSATDETPKPVTCRSCGYSGLIETYEPSMSIYSDCRCPECGSTDNQHNSDYMESLRDAWKKVSGGHQ